MTSEPSESGESEKELEREDKDKEQADDEPHQLEESYARILYFLYFATVASNAIEATKMMICSKTSTTTWCDQQISLCLKPLKKEAERMHHPPPQDVGGRTELVNLSNAFGQLTKAMTDKTLLDM